MFLAMPSSRAVSAMTVWWLVVARFDFEGVDVRGLATELQTTEKRIKELKEQGIQPQVRTS